MQKYKVLLVDDHALFRKGLASLLQNVEELEIAGEAANGREALEKARILNPDIIILDVEMPVMNGVEAVKEIKKEKPDCRIVMLSIADDDDSLFNSIRNGARGYLLKSMDPDRLIEEIKGLMRGEAALSKQLAGRILEQFSLLSQKNSDTDFQRYCLTEREGEVLCLVAQGLTNKEIAQALAIAENTVKNHLGNIMEKLHLQNRVQLATFAWREGLARK